jgi:hypothetical protein
MERDPHHELNNPATDPDPTEWPDPYDKREDPRGPDEEDIPPGATSTSEPHHDQDPDAEAWREMKRADRPEDR